LISGFFGKTARNVATIILCLFTLVEVFTVKLAILQFITIFIAHAFSSGYEEKKKETKEEFNYYVIDKKEEETKSGFSWFSIVFIIIISLFSTFYIFQKRREFKEEPIEIKKDTLVYKEGQRIFEPVEQSTMDIVSNESNAQDYFSDDDNLLEYGKDVGSDIAYCIQNNLSYKYEYALVVKRDIDNEIEKILIQIKDKATSETTIKHISLINRFGDKSQFYDNAFTNCNFVRSYVTGYNVDKDIADWEYGDFIVGDFNFDQNEDFAIKINRAGANVGADYAYYTRRNNGEFILDKFLSGYPPDNSQENNTKVSYSASNENGYTVETHKYNTSKENWYLVKSENKVN
jgi:hypothetical protein